VPCWSECRRVNPSLAVLNAASARSLR